MAAQRSRNVAQHLVHSARASWSNGKLIGYLVTGRCGAELESPLMYLAPSDDVQFCDRCLLAGYHRECVYRAIGTAGESLYIGYTSQLPDRLAQHRRTSAWWPLAAGWDFRYYDNKSAAVSAERQLIREYDPRFNLQFTARAPRPGSKPRAVAP